MKQIYFLVLVCLIVSGCRAVPHHPQASNPGLASTQTGLMAYVYTPNADKSYMYLDKVKGSAEKSILYYGVDKPWKKPIPEGMEDYDHIISPPNSLAIGQNIFLEINEVANIHYKEFLHFIFLDSAKENAQRYLPVLDEDRLKNYFNNPEFYFYPVVGITKEQAEAYCRWKSQVVTMKLEQYVLFQQYEKPNKEYFGGKTIKFTGRLPTADEWLKAGKAAFHESDSIPLKLGKKGIRFLVKNKTLLGYTGEYPTAAKIPEENVLGFNLRGSKPEYLNWDIPFYVYSYKPSSMSYYNLIGNVAEIVQEGFAVGGSYRTPFSEDLLDKEIYELPANDVGFRCVCELSLLE